MKEYLDMHYGDDLSPIWIQTITNQEYSFRDNKDYWITKNGAKLYPNEMTIGHIENTMKFIEKICLSEDLRPSNYIIYNLLKDELSKRNNKLGE